MSKNKQSPFEISLRRLQEISELLENNESDLEKSIDLYEEGIKLSKECYRFLTSAELKVTELKEQLESSIENKQDSDE